MASGGADRWPARENCFQLLESDSKTKVLARPQLRGREGSPLTLTLGDDIPVPQTTVPVLATGGNFTTPSTSYNYRKVGVNLTITPRVTYQDEIILDPLQVERSALGPDVIIAGQSLPTFTDRSATVSLRLRDGESNLLAGLVREEDRSILTSMPGILHLPILRAIFGSSHHTIDQSDIVMIVTPHIVRSHELTPEDLKPLYVGTQSNIGASGPPPLISLENPPQPTQPPTAGVPANPIPASGVTAPPVVPPAQPTTNPRAPGVVPIEPVNPPAAPPPQTPAAQIAATAPAGDVRAGAGQTYAVPITISGVSQLGNVTLSISYNPAVLKATDVVQGTFMQQGRATTVFTPKIDAVNGRIDVAITRPPQAGGASGEGMLASITFQAVAAGNSPVSVTAVATSADGRTIQVQTAPAMVVVK